MLFFNRLNLNWQKLCLNLTASMTSVVEFCRRESKGPSKIGHHFWKQSASKLKFSKNNNNKKPFSKLIFLNNSERFKCFFDIENLLQKSDLGIFWRPMWTSVKVKSESYFSFTDFFWLKSIPCWLTSTKTHHWGHAIKCFETSHMWWYHNILTFYTKLHLKCIFQIGPNFFTSKVDM